MLLANFMIFCCRVGKKCLPLAGVVLMLLEDKLQLQKIVPMPGRPVVVASESSTSFFFFVPNIKVLKN